MESKKIIYKARTGSSFKKEDAQAIGEKLNSLAEKSNGVVTPEMVVEDAKDRSSIFHNLIEWNNEKASEQFRLQQARHIINHVFEVTVIEGKPHKHRSFFSVTNDSKQKVYVTVENALTNKNYKVQLYGRALTQLRNLQGMLEMMQQYEEEH